MGENIRKTFILFGVEIETWVDENAPAPMTTEEDESSSQVLVPPRRPGAGGLELPPNAFFLAKKTLEASDLSRHQSRLLIPNCDKIFEVLNESENDDILNKNKAIGVEVIIMDSREVWYSMNLNRWPSVKNFVLNNGWFKLVNANQLRKGDVVEVWCFRHGSQLCFALDILKKET